MIALVARKAYEIKTLTEYIQRLPYTEFSEDATVKIIEAASGAGALETIKSKPESGKNIDLVITAADEPDINGIELARNLNTGVAGRNIPVMLFCGEVRADMALKARESGVKAYLLLPFSFAKFRDDSTRIVDDAVIAQDAERKTRLETALTEDGSVDIQERLSVAYIKSREKISAILRLAPWSMAGRLSLAKIDCGMNDFNSAIQILKRLIKENFNLRPAHELLVLCYRRLGKNFEDVSELRAMFQNNPSSGVLSQRLGEGLLREGDFNEAIICFRRAIYLHKKTESPRIRARTRVGLGKALMTKADADQQPQLNYEAVSELDMGRRICPDLVSAYFNLVAALRKIGENQKAEETLREVASISPDEAEDWLAMFETYLAEGDVKKARFALMKAIAIDPEDQIITLSAAQAYMRQAMYEEALEMLEQARDVNPSDVQTLNSIGICNRRLRKLAPALDAYSKAQKISPDDPFIHFNKGRTLEDFSRVPDALACYRKALELDPNLAMATTAIERLSSSN